MPILANSPAFMTDRASTHRTHCEETKLRSKHRCAANGCATFTNKPWPFCWHCSQRLPHEMLTAANQLAYDAARACELTRDRRMARLIDHLRVCNEWIRRRDAEKIAGGER